MEMPEGWSPDEHQIYQRLLEAYEEAYRKRERYKRIGPLFVLVSGLTFLALIFSLDTKIEFLVLWVITDLYTIGLMIHAEYRLHRFGEILGLSEPEEEETAREEEVSE